MLAATEVESSKLCTSIRQCNYTSTRNLVAVTEVESSKFWTSIRQCNYASISNIVAVNETKSRKFFFNIKTRMLRPTSNKKIYKNLYTSFFQIILLFIPCHCSVYVIRHHSFFSYSWLYSKHSISFFRLRDNPVNFQEH